ncbi:MAG: DNA mismatch repair endonuclease MutL [Elusimicrobia bacterium]|nr:DNA mismatch repair endonuclease MutL [Elusimicrobiota bacterium]
MTRIIQVLSEDTVSKIAAGEVIERPASVLKELLENSIDAGASKIQIDVENAGRGLIRVSDDGDGIPAEQCALAFERHATSKIRKLEDLDTLETMGFRGEALASIAAISEVALTSAVRGAATGAHVEVHGGKLVSRREAPPVAGTTVSVRSLFYNTPARAKFLKSDAVEKSHLTQRVEEVALAHPGISVVYRVGGAEIIATEGKPEPDAADSLAERIRGVLGKGIRKVQPLLSEHSGWKIYGMVSGADGLVASRNVQYWFINRRPFASRTAQQALYRAYAPYRSANQHPACVVFIEMPPLLYDVNSHPTKRDIRFRHENDVYDLIYRAVSKLLVDSKPAVPILKSEPEPPAPEPRPSPADLQTSRETPSGYPSAGAAWTNAPQISKFPTAALASASPVDSPTLRFLGQIEKTYLVFEQTGGLVILDQHAAAERVFYERYLKDLRSNTLQIQNLMLPVQIELPPSRMQKVMEHAAWLSQMGFEIQPMGKSTLLIKSMPSIFDLSTKDCENLIHLVLDSLGDPTEAAMEAAKEKIAGLACRAAVKAHQNLAPMEAIQLYKDIHLCRDGTCCPHGRPTAIRLNRNELARRFQRPGAP